MSITTSVRLFYFSLLCLASMAQSSQIQRYTSIFLSWTQGDDCRLCDARHPYCSVLCGYYELHDPNRSRRARCPTTDDILDEFSDIFFSSSSHFISIFSFFFRYYSLSTFYVLYCRDFVHIVINDLNRAWLIYVYYGSNFIMSLRLICEKKMRRKKKSTRTLEIDFAEFVLHCLVAVVADVSHGKWIYV